jgi:hypothetical protein
MVQLSIIVKAILADLYGLHGSSEVSKRRDDRYSLTRLVKMITESDTKLQNWSKSLPLRLQFDEAIKSPTSDWSSSSDRHFEYHLFQLQALALKLAFENARILVYRPLLSYRRIATTQATRQKFMTQNKQPIDPFNTAIHICRDAAFQISLLGSLPIFQQAADTYAVSFVSLHLFTAGITLSILTSIDPLSQESHESKMGLRRLMEMQNVLKSKSIIAEQGLGVLKTLMSLILEKEAKKIFDFNSSAVEDQVSLDAQNLPQPSRSFHQAGIQASSQFSASAVESSNNTLSSTAPPATSPSFLDEENISRFDIDEDPSMIQALFNLEQSENPNIFAPI